MNERDEKMQIKFKTLNLTNFKCHKDLEVKFGDLTKILADNYQGKSSIGEAITFLLYGNDLMGSKLDPTPVTYEADSSSVTLLLSVEEKDVLLGREIANGTNKFYINEVPSKATEFNEIVIQLFDKDLFLSLFNPNYFFTMHWEKQRSMLLQYVTAPANKEVFKELPKLQAEKLAELVKKHSLEQLEKIHRENKNKKDKAYIAAQSRTKTLKEQLGQQGSIVPIESLTVELKQLTKERDEKELITDAAGNANGRINVLHNQIDNLTVQIDKGRNDHTGLKGQAIDTNCHSCGQDLEDEAKAVAEKNKENQLQNIADHINPLIQQRKAFREELSTLNGVEVPADLKEDIKKLQDKIFGIEHEINKHKQIEQLDKDIESATTDEIDIKESLNESVFILGAIKAFDAKEAEMQAEKVQELFENLSIKLFETVKSSGENKATFIVQMDGKDYLKLSLSESIRAGLELRDVLSEQSDVIAPCFVDNAESITKFKVPNGQLITAKVVAGQKLTIESEEK